MDDKSKPATTAKTPEETPIEPNVHLKQFLAENNYELSVDALTDNNPFLEGKGFVLTDRPLLVVSIKKKGDK